MTQLPSADSILSTAPAAKFDNPGDMVQGVLLGAPEAIQQSDFASGEPTFWKDGQPKMQVVIRIMTASGDELKVYAKSGALTAIKKASRVAGAPLREGGELSLTYTGDGEAKRGMNPPKLFSAAYDPPADTGSPASGNPPF